MPLCDLLKPFLNLAQATTAGGAELSLHSHDTHFYLRANRQPLMGTNASESEMVLASLACGRLQGMAGARILIGGLGFGFSLRRVLELVPADAVVHVAELVPEVVAWNREYLGAVNGQLLEDARVEVFVQDVFEVLKKGAAAPYDAILLDVDNGPIAMVDGKNDRLYDTHGFAVVRAALAPGALVAYWSAKDDRPFVKRLIKDGFTVETIQAKAYAQAKKATHRIFVAKPGAAE